MTEHKHPRHDARSAIDGRFVSDTYAKEHPDTTVHETRIVRFFKRLFRRKEKGQS